MTFEDLIIKWESKLSKSDYEHLCSMYKHFIHAQNKPTLIDSNLNDSITKGISSLIWDEVDRGLTEDLAEEISCLKCEKQIVRHRNVSNILHDNIEGSDFDIYPGYGSRHDSFPEGLGYVGALCDDCISDLATRNILKEHTK